MRILSPLFFALVLTMGTVASADEPVGASTKRFKTDNSQFAQLRQDPGYRDWFSGVIMVSSGHETRLLHCQGVDRAGRQLTQDSIFWLGSNAKMLTAAVILHLAQEDRLSLEDAVGSHLAGLSATDITKDGESCTIERLLSHQCGLPTNVPLQDYAALADPIRRPEIREAFLNHVRNAPLSFTPGTGYQYSNVAYTLAGLIILEHDTGTFDEIAQRRLFEPLGLKSTGFEPTRITDFSERVAPLSVNLGPWALSSSAWLGLEETSPAWTGPAGGGFSTPAEYSRLVKALFSGSLLSPEFQAKLVTPIARSKGAQGEPDYALGVGVRQVDGQIEFTHGGALEPHGFSTHLVHRHREDLTFVVMSNRGLKVYDARAVNKALLAMMKDGIYVSPFPSGADGWFKASKIGLVHLVLIPLLILSLLITAFRPAKNGRAALALGLVVRAWVLLFFRGLLGIHTGDAHALGLFGFLMVIVVLVLWYRFKRQPQMPRFPPKSAWFGRTRAWLFMILGITVMAFFALLVKIFTIQTLVLLGIAVGAVTWRRADNGSLQTQAAV